MALVDCNGKVVGEGADAKFLDGCTLQDLGVLIVKIFDYMIDIVFLLAVLGIAVGGLYIIFGGASEGNRIQGKSIIGSSILGLFVAAAAWVIVNTILVGLGAEGFRNPLKVGIF
ncbi:MAG TPA: hypothetical protein VJB98_04085 [Candidatus Paceibacterota bacterium]